MKRDLDAPRLAKRHQLHLLFRRLGCVLGRLDWHHCGLLMLE